MVFLDVPYSWGTRRAVLEEVVQVQQFGGLKVLLPASRRVFSIFARFCLEGTCRSSRQSVRERTFRFLQSGNGIVIKIESETTVKP